MPDMGIEYNSVVFDEGVDLGHAHYACLDKWVAGEFPRCCKCNGHRCKNLHCEIPSTDKRMIKKLLDQMSLEVFII